MRFNARRSYLSLTCLAAISCGEIPGVSTQQSNDATTVSRSGSVVLVIDDSMNALAGSTIELDASDSYHEDGEDLDFGWSQRSGPLVQLIGGRTARAEFDVPLVPPTTLSFDVSVSDGMDTVSGTMNIFIVATEAELDDPQGLGTPGATNDDLNDPSPGGTPGGDSAPPDGNTDPQDADAGSDAGDAQDQGSESQNEDDGKADDRDPNDPDGDPADGGGDPPPDPDPDPEPVCYGQDAPDHEICQFRIYSQNEFLDPGLYADSGINLQTDGIRTVNIAAGALAGGNELTVNEFIHLYTEDDIRTTFRSYLNRDYNPIDPDDTEIILAWSTDDDNNMRHIDTYKDEPWFEDWIEAFKTRLRIAREECSAKIALGGFANFSAGQYNAEFLERLEGYRIAIEDLGLLESVDYMRFRNYIGRCELDSPNHQADIESAMIQGIEVADTLLETLPHIGFIPVLSVRYFGSTECGHDPVEPEDFRIAVNALQETPGRHEHIGIWMGDPWWWVPQMFRDAGAVPTHCFCD